MEDKTIHLKREAEVERRTESNFDIILTHINQCICNFRTTIAQVKPFGTDEESNRLYETSHKTLSIAIGDFKVVLKHMHTSKEMREALKVATQIHDCVKYLSGEKSKDLVEKWNIVMDTFEESIYELTVDEKSTFQSRFKEDLASVEILQKELAKKRGTKYKKRKPRIIKAKQVKKKKQEVNLPDLPLRTNVTKSPEYNIETDYIRQDSPKEEGASKDEMESSTVASKKQTSETFRADEEKSCEEKQNQKLEKKVSLKRKSPYTLGIGATLLQKDKT